MPDAIETTATRRAELPLAGRQMEIRSFSRAQPGEAAAAAPLATARLVLAAGAAVRRYDWMRERYYDEVLVMEPGAVRLGRLQRGAPLLNTHNAWDLESVLGKLSNPEVADGRIECDAAFSRRESVAGYVQDVADGIVVNVSVGYARYRVEMVPPAAEGQVWTYRVVDYEIFEGSLVPIPADMDAQVIRSAAGAAEQPDQAGDAVVRTYPCEFIEIRSTPTVGTSAATTTQEETAMPGATQGGNNTPANPAAADSEARFNPAITTPPAATGEATAVATAVQAEAARSAQITELCQRSGLAQLAPDFIRNGRSVADVGLELLNELARRDASGGGQRNVSRVENVTDEVATRMAGMQEAVLHRVHAGTALTDNGRHFRGMTMLELAREFLELRGINTRGMARMDIAGEALRFRSGRLGTSDFSSLMANVANKRLRMGYEENPGTYTRWARRAPNAPDFKNISVVQLSATPDLLQVNEHGEFKYSSMSDGGETYALLTYGRVVSLTRQAIVNDDLRAFDRLVSGFGSSAARLENRTVYAQITANANMADGNALFSSAHANNSTGAGSALQLSALATGRTAMRLQKGLQNEELNLAPSFLIVPAALENTAYQLTSPNYVPATTGAINEFRSGGRTALEPVVEPILDANSAAAWYLAAQNSQVDTVEYCYLDGAEGPVMDSEIGFDTDGMSVKCRLDFAAKAIDWRGMHRGVGS